MASKILNAKKRSSHLEVFLKNDVFFSRWCWHFHRFSCLRRTFQNGRIVIFCYRSIMIFKEQINSPSTFRYFTLINIWNFVWDHVFYHVKFLRNDIVWISVFQEVLLSLSWRRSLSNQSVHWFLYDRDLLYKIFTDGYLRI